MSVLIAEHLAQALKDVVAKIRQAKDISSLRATHEKSMCQIQPPQKTVMIETSGAGSVGDIDAIVQALNAGGVEAVRL